MALVACLAGTAACGKKGPPLPPFAKAPAIPPETSARRMGDRVEIRFTVPSSDIDAQEPASIDRVEVWALTTPTASPEHFRKYGTLVGSVPVRKPPPPSPDVEEDEPPPPPPPPSTEPGLDQGQPGIILDELTPDEFETVTIPELEKARAREEEALRRRREQMGEPKLSPPDVGRPLDPPPTRIYMVVGRNGGRWGAPQRIPVPLTPLPPAPVAPEVALEEKQIRIAWTEPEGVRRPVHAGTAAPSRPAAAAAATGTVPAAGAGASPDAGEGTPAGVEPEPDLAPLLPPGDEVRPVQPALTPSAETPDADAEIGGTEPAMPEAPSSVPAPPQGAGEPDTDASNGADDGEPALLPSRSLAGFPRTTIGYNVYLVPPPGWTPVEGQPGEVPLLPRRLTPSPVAALTFTDPLFEVGVERCYAVRTVETTGAMVVESAPSPAVCVTPQDTFPPAAPGSLAAVASEGAISLIWDPNGEPDLAGYLVLRAEASGGELAPLMTEPIRETTYRDTTVKPGVRYVYAVVAVDRATPPNRSAPSNRVEEVAR